MAEHTPTYVGPNAVWWESRHQDQQETAQRHWSQSEPVWGIFAIPESTVGLLGEVQGADVAELGCGTAYVSAWLARRGARPVAIDPTPGQLHIAQACQQEFGVTFPLVRAVGEQVPLASASFDLVISEYGAAIWADPYRWIPEAARLLRPGGELIFLGNSTLAMLCMPDLDGIPAGDRLVRPHFGMHRFEWPEDPTVEFHLGHGDWIRLFRANGLDVEDLVELRPTRGLTVSYPTGSPITPEWADRWPCEEAWKLRRR